MILAQHRETDQWNRTASLEIDPRTSGKVDTIKIAFQISEESV